MSERTRMSEAGCFPGASSGKLLLTTRQTKLGGTADAKASVPIRDGRYSFK
jgi:hypothetical protein